MDVSLSYGAMLALASLIAGLASLLSQQRLVRSSIIIVAIAFIIFTGLAEQHSLKNATNEANIRLHNQDKTLQELQTRNARLATMLDSASGERMSLLDELEGARLMVLDMQDQIRDLRAENARMIQELEKTRNSLSSEVSKSVLETRSLIETDREQARQDAASAEARQAQIEGFRAVCARNPSTAGSYVAEGYCCAGVWYPESPGTCFAP